MPGNDEQERAQGNGKPGGKGLGLIFIRIMTNY